MTIEGAKEEPEEEPREPEIYPDDQVPEISVEFYEYDCGSPCTENGCMGHVTDIPVSIEIDNVSFEVSGYWGGDYPREKATIAEVKSVIARLERALALARKE
jgi:hypothetical protein